MRISLILKPAAKALVLAFTSGWVMSVQAQNGTSYIEPGFPLVTNFMGWGTSLSWWANVTGGYTNRNAYAALAFTSLKLNIVRYNIGAGENPSLPDTLQYRAQIPGFEPANGVWNWNVDANQRWMLRQAVALGANHVVAVAASPPWWMTVSGSVTGAVGGTNNLQTVYETTFAGYIATVINNLTLLDGVHFDVATPMNEPTGTWWIYGNSQEGCHMDANQQARVIYDLKSALNSQNLTTGIDASEDTDEQDTINSINTYGPGQTNVAIIATHSYQANNPSGLRNLAASLQKPAWISEYGDPDGTGMTMARRIHDDITGAGVGAWVYWQVVDNAAGWGFLYNPLDGSSNTTYTINEKFYVMGQFSEYIRPGSQILNVNDNTSLAAYNPTNQTLVIVAVNDSASSLNLNYNLAGFARLPGQVSVVRTSPTENMSAIASIPISNQGFSTTLIPQSVTTFVMTNVSSDPAISITPTPQWSLSGGTVSFNVGALGTAPFTYQWQAGTVGSGGPYTNLANGGQISGATNPVLSLSNVSMASALDYRVVISNSKGSITSSPPATLTVQPGVPIAIGNYSFESPTVAEGAFESSSWPSWTTVTSGSAIVAFVNPGTFATGEAVFPTGSPSGMDGSNFCQIFAYGTSGSGMVYQDTGIKYVAGVTYTLTAAFGLQASQTFDNNGAVLVFYNSSLGVIASRVITATNLILGTFSDLSLTYTATGNEGGNGDILVGFSAPPSSDGQTYLDVDNVRLARAQTNTVLNLNDNGPGSLRAAIGSSIPGNVINFAPGLSGTITLTSGELAIGQNLTITGPGAKVLTVSGNNSSRVFNISSGTVVISGLTIANGYHNNTWSGGGIENVGTLTVSNCTMVANHADEDGGAIHNDGGSLTVVNCTFNGNSASFGNAGDVGGAIDNQGTAIILNSTFFNNISIFGGAIGNETSGTLLITNCTLSGNNGAGNAQGGGIYDNGGHVTIRNTILAGNSAGVGPEYYGLGTLTSGGFNLIGKTNDSTGWIATDLKGSSAVPLNPLLSPLQDNGGQTYTMAPLPGSPAIDAGNSSGLTTDQRGWQRSYDFLGIPNAAGSDGSDIGAVEVSPPALSIVLSSGNAVLSWSTNYPGYALETTTSLNPPAVWSLVPGTPTIIGSQFMLSAGSATYTRFFRLAPYIAGSALSFDGVAAYVNIGAAPLLPPWTAEFWVNRQDASNYSASLLGDGNTALKLEQFNFSRQVGFTQFGVADYTFNYSAPTNTWVHLAFVCDTTTRLYVNGVLQDSNPNVINLPLGSLGYDSSGHPDFLKGTIDEIRAWNVARTQAQIQADMNHTLTVPQINLVGYWRFDEASGPSAADSSGQGKAGTLQNNPIWFISSAPLVP